MLWTFFVLFVPAMFQLSTVQAAPLVGLLVGAALRTLLPYVSTGLEEVAKAQDWKAWPKFQPSYLAMFALAVIGFGVSFLTVPGAFTGLMAWGFVQAVALAYSGGDIGRQLIKGGAATVRMVRGR